MPVDNSTAAQTPHRRAARRRSRRLPTPVAAGAVGVLVGLLAQTLITGGEYACNAIRGTSACDSAGFAMLAVVAAVAVYVGRFLLRTLRVPEAGVASVLGLALLAIAMLTVLMPILYSPWIWVGLPAVAAVVYAFAAWAADTLTRMGHG
jgi:hypothetical protein